jgi:hypothetical protein
LVPIAGSVARFGVGGAGQTPSAFLAEALLARKIGVASLLEQQRIRGLCALRMLGSGSVDDPTGTGIAEWTRMYTLAIDVEVGAQLVPDASASYSQIRWVTPTDLRDAWQSRDGQRLFPDANPLEICIRGLCIRSGVALLTGSSDRS